jgi:hypothetical protein
LFFQPPTFSVSGLPVVADFNQDGKLDLADPLGDVLLGNGDGTFKPAAGWNTTGQSFSVIATADFNGDGKPDLLAVSPNFLYVILGKGDGTFQPAVTTATGTALNSVFIADVNGDGKPDVLSVTPGGTVVVYLGNGDGAFASPKLGPTIGSLAAVADLNGDGKIDLLVLAGGAGSNGVITTPQQTIVFLGNGDGTFQSSMVTSTLAGVLGAGVGSVVDLNGDGKLDLVLSGQSPVSQTFVNQTFTALGNGDGTFRTPVAVAGPASALAAADINGDGKPDLIVQGFPYLQIFLGKGDGTFLAKGSYFLNTPSGSQVGIIVADFTGDHKPDLATADVMLIGNGDGTFQGNPAALIGIPSQSIPSMDGVVTGDFNGDGNPDMAVFSSSNGTHNLAIFLGDGSGRLSLTHTYSLPEIASSVAVADLNGDGKLDFIFVSVATAPVQWTLNTILGNGDGSFGAPMRFPQGQAFSSIPLVVADLNRDNKPDVVALDTAAGTLMVFLGQGDGTFAAPVSYLPGASPTTFVMADFDNDGKIDAVVAGSSGLGLLLGNGDGTFQSVTFPVAPMVGNFVEAAADFNGDGSEDLIYAGYVFLGGGDGTFKQTVAVPPLSNIQVSDINGDGKLDLVGNSTVKAPGLLVSVALGNGDGTFGSLISILQSPQPGVNVPNIVDLNHDGRPDILVPVFQTQAGIAVLLNTSQPPAPDFLISASLLSPATVAPGSSGTSTVRVTPVGGFSGGVTLSCSGLPSGANCNITPGLLAGSGTSALTISTASSTSVGSYPVNITGASAAATHVVTVTLAVASSAGATTVGLAPTTLTFAQQASETTSAPQAVELTNIGKAPFSISGISLTGANPGDFAQVNTCGSSVAAGASCQINVTFTPAGLASRTASLSVKDNATGSPQMVTLTGTGPDFSLASGGAGATTTVKAGQTATYSISVSPVGGLNQSVTLSCSGAPAKSMCSVSPNPVTLSASAATTVAVTVTTTAASQGAAPFGFETRIMRIRPLPLACGSLGVLVVMLMVFYYGSKERRLRWTPLLALAIPVCVGMTAASCGGGSLGGGGGGGSIPGTPSGTYTISVAGSVGSGATAVTHVTKLTLVVQ